MAWEFIVERLEEKVSIEEVELRQPLGKKGYVLLIDLGASSPLYVKLQLGSGRIIGRSFHYSDGGST